MPRPGVSTMDLLEPPPRLDPMSIGLGVLAVVVLVGLVLLIIRWAP
jgi:hypothetical protein